MIHDVLVSEYFKADRFQNRYILLNKQILFGEILILWCTKWGFEVKSSESISGQTAGYGLGTCGNKICIFKMKLIKWSSGALAEELWMDKWEDSLTLTLQLYLYPGLWQSFDCWTYTFNLGYNLLCKLYLLVFGQTFQFGVVKKSLR